MTARGAVVELATRRTALRQTLVPASAILACLLVAAHAPAELRAPVLIAFLCAAPGAALVGLLSPDSLELEVALALAMSVALSGLIALVLVYAHLWSPTAVVLIVAAVTLGGGLRDVDLGRRAHAATTWLGAASRPALGTARRGAARFSSAAAAAGAVDVRSADARLRGAAAAPVELARRAELRRRTRFVLVTLDGFLHRGAQRARSMAALSPARTTIRRSPVRPAVSPPVSESSLESFLLGELRRSARAQSGRRRWRSGSLAQLEPGELEDLVSWSSLQRFVTQRAVQQIKPELWQVDDLERLFRRASASRREASAPTAPPAPRGAWITGVSQGASVPVAWRVLEDGEAKEWRTRLALDAIDALSGFGTRAVVTAGAAHGLLSGFRRGLEERDLSYLLRVDAVTAARELAPDRPSRSAADAREVVQERLDDAADLPPGPQPGLVLVEGVERLVLCQVAADGRLNAFWLSNLPSGTVPEWLAFLLRLAARHRLERAAPDPLLHALDLPGENDGALERRLSSVALAQGLRTLGLAAAAEGVTEA